MGNTQETKNTLFIIDFGLGANYKNLDGEHIPFKEG